MNKRIFPLITVLITLSLLGIIYIQAQWISNSLTVKREQFSQQIYSVMNRVSEEVISRKNTDLLRRGVVTGLYGFQSTRPTEALFTNLDMKNLIMRELKRENIKQQFEFCVINDLNSPTLLTGGYKIDFFNTPNDYVAKLSTDDDMNKEVLHVYVVDSELFIQRKLLGMLLSSLLFTAVIISAFLLTIRTLLKQKKISEIKNDFINNMTHEFKTPIATISLATDALKNEKVLNSAEQIEYYRNIIKDENRRMNKHVETILQAAHIDKEELNLNFKPQNIHEIIKSVCDNNKLYTEDKHALLKTNFNATKFVLPVDETHFTNAINNLIDNALKYSKEDPEIEISTHNDENHLYIAVKDNGIGMTKETLSNIFEKFYRAHTGNLHNVKGFGLGLSYVKQIIDAHHGKVKVTSVIGKGSEFTIILPLQKKKTD